MEPTQESVPDDGAGAAPPVTAATAAARTRHSLPPKGACWYCDKPLDNVRRFCDKECADAFDEEKEYTR
ncbi:hypothetical protein D0T25_30245 [Duganella sp. BJB488]|uniref:hypothetical protein n=1 Tax=unclassified Duganella TaxID=2636909 RepID=UPI000E349191|nr:MULTISPECIES: hypothetical protein [unclassified Duganella]NVD75044.1 hypothetical protein [Duganella sp. BJB1802]RFP09170.1 hypothetical protein D0T26_30405 [Duganella sp. BJB489]RFP12600.1 hypothetical protein D0T25_30245 [Duganella sp. BJB488]RFP29169.1 hypothetical protein D0T24_30930 [Duganella sp. BJB480]